MYDPAKLKTLEECRIVLKRARDQNKSEFYTAVFQRMYELVGFENDDPNDPLVRDFFETPAAYEQLLTEKNGKNTKASRTRQKISNRGVHQSLIDWTKGKSVTNGFSLLVKGGMQQFTGEYLGVKYRDRFPIDVVELARKRLLEHSIDLPD